MAPKGYHAYKSLYNNKNVLFIRQTEHDSLTTLCQLVKYKMLSIRSNLQIEKTKQFFVIS